jgi:hypothetical protein
MPSLNKHRISLGDQPKPNAFSAAPGNHDPSPRARVGRDCPCRLRHEPETCRRHGRVRGASGKVTAPTPVVSRPHGRHWQRLIPSRQAQSICLVSGAIMPSGFSLSRFDQITCHTALEQLLLSGTNARLVWVWLVAWTVPTPERPLSTLWGDRVGQVVGRPDVLVCGKAEKRKHHRLAALLTSRLLIERSD